MEEGSISNWKEAAAGLILAAAFALPSAGATAATIPVAAQDGQLQAALAAAQPGDTLALAAGIHRGNIVVGKPVTIAGVPGAVLDGNGNGSVITIEAPDVAISGLVIRDSGSDLPARDSGILIKESAKGARIEGNRFENNLFGVYLAGARDAIVRGNIIEGRLDEHVSERGDDVSIWNSPGAQILDNVISDGRDGIFVTTSRNNLFRGNQFHGVRIAVHYMYTNNSEVSGNISSGNHIGYALMYSQDLTVRNNLSQGDRDQGILLNDTNGSRIEGNAVYRGETQCVFIYNASKNALRNNRFEGCPIGIHFTAGSERNVVAGNAFIANQTQVKYVGTRWVEWSENGRGNYWSDNGAFDLDGDGIADIAYRPNDIVDKLVWKYPAAKLLLASPALQVLRLAEAQFPGLHPGGVVDSAPLMQPPPGARPPLPQEVQP
jgi:nitrous oxidase accessory protein